MRFAILGPVQVWAQERRLVLGGPRQVALLAFLVLHANRAVSSDSLIDALWDGTASGGDKRVQMAIARLRKALDPAAERAGQRVRTVSGGYLLAVEPGELDADQFRSGVREGRAALDAGDPAHASTLLRDALALWRGPALAEVAFADFAQHEIRQLDELRLDALEARIEADLQLGRHTGLISELEGLLIEQPARERLAGQLMLALYRSGRQADALTVYQRTRTHLAEELGLEPGPALKALQTQILTQSPALQMTGAAVPVGPAPPPVPATPTIGRRQEIEDVSRLLRRPNVRLVSLTGPGGVGKTRLALTVAHALSSSSPGDVCWIELAGVARPEDVGSTVARALAVTPLKGESTEDALRRYLAGKPLLLVIDNFEHLLEATALIAGLLSACPELRVLATSREALNIAYEHRVLVAPLAVPGVETATVAEIETTDASALFLAAAVRRNSHFAAGPAAASLIAGICARLDGLPLALELAAARTGLLSVGELATELDRAIMSPGAGPRDAPARHQTLQATIEWSYRLLDEEQQNAFVRFAVFAGGAPLDAAQTVTAVPLDTLEALVAKSLFERRQQPDGTTRLVMLETVRQYALQQLKEDPEQDTIHQRHLEHYLHLVEQTAPQLSTHDEREALRVLDGETDNIHAALHWAFEAAPVLALRLAGHLGDYWWIRGERDSRHLLERALQAAGERAPLDDRARAHLNHSDALAYFGAVEAAVDGALVALKLYRCANDHAGMAEALCSLTTDVAIFTGDQDEARRYAEQAHQNAELAGDDRILGKACARLASCVTGNHRRSLLQKADELLRHVGNWRELASAYSNVAYEALKEDRSREAVNLLALALEAADNAESQWWKMRILGNLGWAKLFSGDLIDARDAFEQQLRLCAQDAFTETGEGLSGVSAVAARKGHHEAAARLRGAAISAGELRGVDDESFDARIERDYVVPARCQCDSEIWMQNEAIGMAMSHDEAVSYALQVSQTIF